MNSPLPRVIQAQLDQAEALQAQDQAAREAAQARPAVVDIADLIVPEPPKAPEPPAAVTPQAPAAPVQPAPPPPDPYEQRYKTLQGKYNAEVPALREQVQQLADQLRAVQEARSAQTPTQPQPVEPKDLENFGADLVDFVNRVAAMKAAEAVQPLHQRFAGLDERVQGVAKETVESKEAQFYATLNHLAPDWTQINERPDWLEWLGQVDPVYGLPRQAALDHAIKQLNAERVVRVINAFKAQLPPPPKPPESLQNQVAPEPVGTGAAPPVAQKPILAEAAVQRFYKDLAQGKYRGREAEAKALEAQIDAAVAEGRVR
jgi:hypothetical protein